MSQAITNATIISSNSLLIPEVDFLRLIKVEGLEGAGQALVVLQAAGGWSF